MENKSPGRNVLEWILALVLSGFLFLILYTILGKPEKIRHDRNSGQDTSAFVWTDQGGFLGFFTSRKPFIPKSKDLVLFSIRDSALIDPIKGVSRIIGMPGDTVKIYNGNTYVNGKALKLEKNQINRYSMVIGTLLDQGVFRRSFKNTEIYAWERDSTQNKTEIEFSSTEKKALHIAGMLPVQSMTRQIEEGNNPLIFPTGREEVNGDNYGPVIVPKAGDSIHLNPYWIHLANSQLSDTSLKVFTEDHYFLLNDYRMQGNDSRFFGCLPLSDIQKIIE